MAESTGSHIEYCIQGTYDGNGAVFNRDGAKVSRFMTQRPEKKKSRERDEPRPDFLFLEQTGKQ